MCHEGCNHTGNKGSVVHDTDADDLHRKDRGRHRCAKECGKAGTHAAHDHDALVIFVKVEHVSDMVADAGTDLEGSSLATCGTAAQMGEHGGDKDTRSHAQRYFFPGMDGGDDQIGPLVMLSVEQIVPGDDQYAGERQNIEQPRVSGAHCGGHRHGIRESDAYCADDKAGEDSDQDPFDGCAQAVQIVDNDPFIIRLIRGLSVFICCFFRFICIHNIHSPDSYRSAGTVVCQGRKSF